MSVLPWSALSAICAGMLLVFAATQPTQPVARVVWSALLVIGAVLPFVLLPLAWSHVRYVIPFLGPPVRINMPAVWWALGAVMLSYAATVVDSTRSRSGWWWVLFPPAHAVHVLLRLWR